MNTNTDIISCESVLEEKNSKNPLETVSGNSIENNCETSPSLKDYCNISVTSDNSKIPSLKTDCETILSKNNGEAQTEKKKRGRPRKKTLVTENSLETVSEKSIGNNCETSSLKDYCNVSVTSDNSKVPSLKTDCETILSKNNGEAQTEKKKRGRPKKKILATENGQTLSLKKRGRPRGSRTAHHSAMTSSRVKMRCCALACTNSSNSFYMCELPHDPELRQRWVDSIGRPDWIPKHHSALCEIHFESDMWTLRRNGRRHLVSNAIPTLFLKGDAIKSWVTLDDAHKLIIGNDTNEDNNESIEQMDIDEPNVFIKCEILEPEIDMFEDEDEEYLDSLPDQDPLPVFCDNTFEKQQIEDNRSKKQKFLDKIKADPERWEMHKEKEKQRRLRRKERLQTESSKKTSMEQNDEPINDEKLKTEVWEDSKIRQELKVEALFPGETESIVPDLHHGFANRKFRDTVNYAKGKENLEDSSDSLLEEPIGTAFTSENSHDIPVIMKNDKFQCPFCSKWMTSKYYLQYHIEHHCSEENARRLFKPAMTNGKSYNGINTKILTPTKIKEEEKNILYTSDTTQSTSTLSVVKILEPTETTEEASDESSTSEGILKQILLFVPPKKIIKPPKLTPAHAPLSTFTPDEYSEILSSLYPSELVVNTIDASNKFSVMLGRLPLDTRTALKRKLMELVDAVITRNLDPHKIIIAYSDLPAKKQTLCE